MDETTLQIFAAKLLDVCSLHKGSTIYSIITEFDREPAQFHRMYSNILANHPLIIEVATNILDNDEVKDRDFDALRAKHEPMIEQLRENGEPRRAYCYERILDDMEYFFDRLEEIEPIVGKDIFDIRTDKLPAHMTLLSHVYLTSYIYPPQPFFPHTSNACQHIDFWSDIDYFDFKLMFSEEEGNKIQEFRDAISMNKNAWSKHVNPDIEQNPVIKQRIGDAVGKSFNPTCMIKAMIERMGSLAQGTRYDAIQHTVRDYLYPLGCRRTIHSDREKWFLVNLEKEIEKTIKEML